MSGGVEHYGYLSINGGKLEYEYLWYIDRTGEEPIVYDMSDDTALIGESAKCFSDYEDRSNMVETYMINDENLMNMLGG